MKRWPNLIQNRHRMSDRFLDGLERRVMYGGERETGRNTRATALGKRGVKQRVRRFASLVTDWRKKRQPSDPTAWEISTLR